MAKTFSNLSTPDPKIYFLPNNPQYLYSCTLSLAVQIYVGKIQNNIYIYKEADFACVLFVNFTDFTGHSVK